MTSHLCIEVKEVDKQKSAQSLNLIKLNSSKRSMTILTHARHVTRYSLILHILTKISTHFTALLLIHLMRMPSTNTFIIFQMTLDSQFYYANVDNLMTNNDQCLIFHFKSDSCSQYKSRFVFANWWALAKNYNKTMTLDYGVSGHGKGLVDSMSSFWVKGLSEKVSSQ